MTRKRENLGSTKQQEISRETFWSNNISISINPRFDPMSTLQLPSVSFSLPLYGGLVLVRHLLLQSCVRHSARYGHVEHQSGQSRQPLPLFYLSQGLSRSPTDAQPLSSSSFKLPFCVYLRATECANTTLVSRPRMKPLNSQFRHYLFQFLDLNSSKFARWNHISLSSLQALNSISKVAESRSIIHGAVSFSHYEKVNSGPKITHANKVTGTPTGIMTDRSTLLLLQSSLEWLVGKHNDLSFLFCLYVELLSQPEGPYVSETLELRTIWIEIAILANELVSLS